MNIEEFADELGWTVAETQHLNDVAGYVEEEEAELTQECEELEQFILQEA